MYFQDIRTQLINVTEDFLSKVISEIEQSDSIDEIDEILSSDKNNISEFSNDALNKILSAYNLDYENVILDFFGEKSTLLNLISKINLTNIHHANKRLNKVSEYKKNLLISNSK